MKNKFKDKYKVDEVIYSEPKIQIIEKNKRKPVHEIKKIIKKKYPDITNEEIIKLIVEMNKSRSLENFKKSNKKVEKER